MKITEDVRKFAAQQGITEGNGVHEERRGNLREDVTVAA